MRVKTYITSLALVLAAASAYAQAAPPAQAPNGNAAKPPAGAKVPAGITPPVDYVIGPEDVLGIVFWREKDMSSEVAVRPDGMISLPLINEVKAAGLTPEQLRDELTKAAERYIEVPSVSVVVKAINSRKVFITGMVGKQGAFPLTAPTTVLQMLSMAGGIHEFADAKNIRILRVENGKQVTYTFNYKDVSKGKNLQQNILLKPGDTIIVP
jgi:polysaccharide export outer membrane protein